jgi:hypothetical protein
VDLHIRVQELDLQLIEARGRYSALMREAALLSKRKEELARAKATQKLLRRQGADPLADEEGLALLEATLRDKQAYIRLQLERVLDGNAREAQARARVLEEARARLQGKFEEVELKVEAMSMAALGLEATELLAKRAQQSLADSQSLARSTGDYKQL